MAFTTQHHNSILDLDECIGSRASSFQFHLQDRVSGLFIGDLTPYMSAASLGHDVTRLIKRQLTLDLGVIDTGDINPFTDQIAVNMLIAGEIFPLGEYMFTDSNLLVSTGGRQASVQLVDKMFIVDQEIERSFDPAGPARSHGSAPFISIGAALAELLTGLPIRLRIEPTQFTAVGSWTTGTRRGQIIDAYTTQGDYFSPWFTNAGDMRFIRTIDAASVPATFDFDQHKRIFMDTISRRTNALTAANRFIVVSNTDAGDAPIVGSYDIPASAPHSIANRGFVIPDVEDIQLSARTDANRIARGLALRNTAVEVIEFDTPADPRHDSYDVLRVDGLQWLEIGWSIDLTPGGAMHHIGQRAYA
jgi:hypothetical protein